MDLNGSRSGLWWTRRDPLRCSAVLSFLSLYCALHVRDLPAISHLNLHLAPVVDVEMLYQGRTCCPAAENAFYRGPSSVSSFGSASAAESFLSREPTLKGTVRCRRPAASVQCRSTLTDAAQATHSPTPDQVVQHRQTCVTVCCPSFRSCFLPFFSKLLSRNKHLVPNFILLSASPGSML